MTKKREFIEHSEGERRYIRRGAKGKIVEKTKEIGRSPSGPKSEKAKTGSLRDVLGGRFLTSQGKMLEKKPSKDAGKRPKISELYAHWRKGVSMRAATAKKAHAKSGTAPPFVVAIPDEEADRQHRVGLAIAKSLLE